ncbi:MAG: RluA family pseudouridine synthase [Magnetococcales bacterium]|nr:RluA family pseudouridine synthase [Magnetococcales bacterium]
MRIGDDWHGSRVDRFLKAEHPTIPLSAWQKLMRKGRIRVNGGRVRGNVRLQKGDEVRIPPLTIETDGAESKSGAKVPRQWIRRMEQRILFQDEHVCIVGKPPGIVVHGGSGQPWGIIDLIRELPVFKTSKNLNPELCHRLDRDTSGCLVFGLNRQATRSLTEAFRMGQVRKRYLALVRGVPTPSRGVIDQPLVKGKVRGGERMVVVENGGDAARTRYRLVRRFHDAALVEMFPETGRTHQIRVHGRWLGHPLAQDRKYGDREFNNRMKSLKLKRLFLHAEKVSFRHPITGDVIDVHAPLEQDLHSVVKRLADGAGEDASEQESRRKKRRERRR